MKKEKKCFCGNRACKDQLHKTITLNSKYAKTFKLYKNIDKKINEDIYKFNLSPKCGKGCSECCHQLFPISEIELCIITDYLLEHEKSNIENIFKKSVDIYRYVKNEDPIYFHKLVTNIDGGDIDDLYNYSMISTEITIPQGCIFLNERNECSIYEVRPLICRTHGVAYFSKDEVNKICSKLIISNNNRDRFVDLTSYEDEIISLTFLRWDGKLISKRPYPIFYWFCYLRENNISLKQFRKTNLYNRVSSMSENEMIDHLLKYR